jgi:dipeptidyl aminopeptidase/acylaminoacyl peptidase
MALHGSKLSGTVTQGSLHGTIRLTRGGPTFTRFLGTYRIGNGDTLIVLDLSRLGYPPQVIDVGADGVRGLYRRNATRYAVGAGQQVRAPPIGVLSFARDGESLRLQRGAAGEEVATRMPFRAEEVRLRDGKVPLAGTLLLPGGAGPFPAVVMAHGSGPSLRDEGQAFANFLAADGIASLTMDKRGEGESGGTYLGEFAGKTAIAGYAADVVAGGRFLARLPDIDAHRIGLFGGSQAGWVIPRAAAE